MNEPCTTPEQRAELRRRYLAHPGVISCTVCREWMELLPPERDTIGVLWTWRCPRAYEHPRLRYIDHHADMDVLAALDDADALAGALAEVARLRAAMDLEDRSEDPWAEVARLRAALAFYADPANWQGRLRWPVTCDREAYGAHREPAADEDGGDIARAALAPDPSPEPIQTKEEQE